MINKQNEIKCRNCEKLNPLTATKCYYCGFSLPKRFPVKPLGIALATLTIGIVGYFGFKTLNLGGKTPISSTNADFILLGDTFSGYSTFRNDEFKKLAKEELGLSLQYQDEFDQKKRAELLNQGKAGLLVTTLDQFLQQKPQGKIIGLIDRTIGADAVVLNTKKYPNLKSLLDLDKLVQQVRSQGQQLKITFAGDTPSEYLAIVLSTKFEDFKLSNFEVVKVADAKEAWKLLQDNNENVAVAIIWEPYVTQARQNGYTVLLSSKDVPNAIVDVIVASDSLISAQPEKLSEFLAAYYRRMDAYVLDSSKLKTQIAEDGKLTDGDATAVLEGINFFPSLEAEDWLKNGTLKDRIVDTGRVLALANKINQVPQNPQDLYNSELITKAAKNTKILVAQNPSLTDRLTGKTKINGSTSNNPVNITDQPSIGNLKKIGEIKFQTDSADILEGGKLTLDKVAQEIAQLNEQTVAIRIIGHTSKTGTVEHNQELSQQRAKVVVDYLRPKLKHKIESEGKGFNEPLPNITPEDISNQRTEIRVVRINN